MSCGASLAQPIAQERRTVSILFADLAGFTERSDAADPEDVRRTLVPFHERAKGAIERFGGHAGQVHRRRGDGRVRRAGRP